MNIQPRLVVYTAVTGGHDVLCPPVVRAAGVRYICFTDGEPDWPLPAPWERRALRWRHTSQRRSARFHKIMAHELFPDAEVTIWHDGSQQMTCSPWDLVGALGLSAGLATFRHPQRDCVYDELMACLRLRKDDPAIMRAQIERYRRQGMPAHCGLFETACVVRRSGGSVEALNTQWWQELVNYSCRDQLSLPYVLWRDAGLHRTADVICLPGCRAKSPFFRHRPHRC